MTDDQIKSMVDKFLAWRLPDGFCPDGGVSFSPNQNPAHWPVGTNLLDYGQAKAMVENMVSGLK